MRIVNKRKFFKSTLILVFIVVMLIICISQMFNKEEITPTETQYTVSKGETLWDIAQRFKQEDQDIREYIYEIKKINNMTSSSIYDGQTITILIYED